MIIGGYALPFYGRIRTTIDLDLAVAIKTEKELLHLSELLQLKNYQPILSSFLNPLIVISDLLEKVEIELWIRPDGIVFNDEMLKRRRKFNLDENIKAWIVSPEDFIINKLARPDRGVRDEQDVKSVLERQRGNLDEEYLVRRAQDNGIFQVLKMIQDKGS